MLNFVNEYCSFNDSDKTLTFDVGLSIIRKNMVPEDIKTITEKIIIPDSVNVIDVEAFSDYRKLTNIAIPDSVKIIAEYAFRKCDSMKYIHLGTGVHTICGGCFYACEALKKVYIKNLSNWCKINFQTHFSNPLSHGADLYVDNKIVKNLIIPDNVEYVSKDAFFSCQSIETIQIPSNIKHIEDNVFWNCTNIKSVKIEDGLTSIGDNVFYNCQSLSDIKLPASLCFIGKNALNTYSNNLMIKCPANKFFKQWARDNDFDIYTSKINQFINSVDLPKELDSLS